MVGRAVTIAWILVALVTLAASGVMGEGMSEARAWSTVPPSLPDRAWDGEGVDYEATAAVAPRKVTGPAPPPTYRMVGAYTERLQELARSTAGELGVRLRQGVYMGSLGPTYETPAEIRMAQLMGASAVGMSTALFVNPGVVTAVPCRPSMES